MELPRREFIVFVWPLAALPLWRRIEWREWPWGLAPVAATGVGEMILDAREYGDPLARLHAGSGLGDLPSRPEVAATFHDLPLWVYLWRLPQQLARLAEGPGLLLLLALTVAAGVVVCVRRLRGPVGREEGWAGLFALWVMLLWVPLTLLGGVLNPAHPSCACNCCATGTPSSRRSSSAGSRRCGWSRAPYARGRPPRRSPAWRSP